jgi:hypothetical protein
VHTEPKFSFLRIAVGFRSAGDLLVCGLPLCRVVFGPIISLRRNRTEERFGLGFVFLASGFPCAPSPFASGFCSLRCLTARPFEGRAALLLGARRAGGSPGLMRRSLASSPDRAEKNFSTSSNLRRRTVYSPQGIAPKSPIFVQKSVRSGTEIHTLFVWDVNL